MILFPYEIIKDYNYIDSWINDADSIHFNYNINNAIDEPGYN